MQFAKVIINRGPMEKISKVAPAYEIPLLLAKYGEQAVLLVDACITVNKGERQASGEFARLRTAYPGDENTGDVPYVDVVFGRFGAREFARLFKDASRHALDLDEFFQVDIDEAFEDEPDEDEPPNDTKPIGKLTKDELLALADEQGIEVADNATKADIIEALQTAHAA